MTLDWISQNCMWVKSIMTKWILGSRSLHLLWHSIIPGAERKKEHIQNSNVTYQKNNNAQNNKRSQNHEFRYMYDYMSKRNHNNNQSNNKNIFNPYWSYKIYC
jgi:hypothetical protein